MKHEQRLKEAVIVILLTTTIGVTLWELKPIDVVARIKDILISLNGKDQYEVVKKGKVVGTIATNTLPLAITTSAAGQYLTQNTDGSLVAASTSTSKENLTFVCRQRKLTCRVSQEATKRWHIGADSKDGSRWYIFSYTEEDAYRSMLIHLHDEPDWLGTAQSFILGEKP